jgi:hypothetical protein
VVAEVDAAGADGQREHRRQRCASEAEPAGTGQRG